MEKKKRWQERNRSPDGLSHPNLNTIIIWLYFIRNEKKVLCEIQLTKKKNVFAQSNNEKSSTLTQNEVTTL